MEPWLNMGEGGKKLTNEKQEIKEPEESLDDLEMRWLIFTKYVFIEFLQIQLIKQEKETINATCETSDLIHLDTTRIQMI